ncbi:MAG: MotA/TolQ/ExbB proton channel family protein [Planctomycetota bacterium]|nr:MAG: MotA/TolQ/ExbB proton channel family protein [Planctomycetota bacterium]
MPVLGQDVRVGGGGVRSAPNSSAASAAAEIAAPGGRPAPAGATGGALVGTPPDAQESAAPRLDLRELARAGGLIGAVIAGLSVAMVALIVEHFFSIRRRALMPVGLADALHRQISAGRFNEARQQCKSRPSFLAHVVEAGLAEADLGYDAVEKAMEDAATEQAARLFRKIEYLQVIGTLAPMLGLLGTVWGMILAFLEFESKANPQVSELAPGIYRALVTTLMGLGVAVPALAAYAIFRNRIDELAAEATLTAEQVFAEYKRAVAQRRIVRRAAETARPAPAEASRSKERT